jgi:D-sedoheptulose 7-phosphate isomerase
MAAPDASRTQKITAGLKAAAAVHERLAASGTIETTAKAAGVLIDALSAGGTMLAFGNGGSAADAQHVVAELVGRFVRERRAWPAVALSVDTSILTAVGNDYGFDQVFSRQIEALGRKGDVALGITTSGESPNVVKALEAGKARGLATIALTGKSGGAAGRIADVHMNVPETSTARIQEAHITLLHLLCELVDDELAG